MLHPSIQVQPVANKGRGLIATTFIHEGEVVWQETEADQVAVFTKEELAALPIEIARLSYWDRERQTFAMGVNDPSDYMNHSCDPNLWWDGEYTLTARRDILPGEEVTYDYATSEIHGMVCGKPEMPCSCGAPDCRKVIRPDDLERIPALREKYAGHLSPSVEKWLREKTAR